MRIALQGYARQHRAVFASRLNFWTSLQNRRYPHQISAMNEDVNSKYNMEKVTDSQEAENQRNDATTSAQEVSRHRRSKNKPPKEPSPDHFLALRLSHDPSVISTITSIQNAIAQHSPHLKQAFIEPITAHLTLGVLQLPDAATKEAAQAALLGAATAAALTMPLSVTLQGIGNFRNQVVYLDLTEAEQILQLAATVRQYFGQQGLLLQADRAFVPHVTIAKLSKVPPWQRGAGDKRKSTPWRRRQRQRQVSIEESEKQEELTVKEEETVVNVDSSFAASIEASSKEDKDEGRKMQQLFIPEASYSSLSTISTSAVEVTELQLCAMEGRNHGEYYKVISSVRLQTVDK
ncbi:hypothetical protein Ndes2526B_g05537 [Nannochloris sp. 'desiccata']|nr:hypothetical protein KSW81_007400 [Chlorella desiccata (nom. nud.)]KAH7618627.1 putative A-kinase anchor protein 7 isoform gamma [Chlorella desiccata (nom. nud.)]